jgi:ABC-type antimicrobial peptide transport system permease subunit
MALGATTTQIELEVLGKTMRLSFIGIGLGMVVSLGLSSVIASMLFEVQPTDVVTFSSVAGLLCVVALVAGYLPARRASRIRPVVALRAD